VNGTHQLLVYADNFNLVGEHIFYICFAAAQAALLLRVLDQTHTNTHRSGRTPLNEWSARRRDRYLYNTQQKQTNIHALSQIRTCDPNNHASKTYV